VQGRFGDVHRIAATQDMGDGGNARIVWAMDGTLVALTQQGVAASMVAVMVGDQHGGQSKLLRVEKGDQGC